jgi:hypothetical protein
MATDRARRSFDASRMYRTVVAQQGRVTIEADANEADEIRSAESRAQLRDLVGPTGTPDDGFKITVPNPTDFGFSIGAGTLYVGGVRLERAQPETYEHQKQTEWVDRAVPDPALPTATTALTELVYLTVTEQEVSAVEDPALREVALGGPDTAGRTRMISRVHRAPMAGIDCEVALAKVLDARGLAFDPDTQALRSSAQLRVDFVPVPGPADVCQPIAQAGFLGAENQLIRIQVTSDRSLLWGYDNSSFLYRVTVNGRKLALQGTPVDTFHRPRVRQRVEVLATAANLGTGAHVASAVGAPCEIAGYDASANVITLTADLPPAVLDLIRLSTPPPQMFVRIWENQLPFVGDGTTPTTLVTPEGASIGLDVYTGGAPVPGDYWMVGVRPSMPDAIFPARLAQLQPPDGPHRWATPLATIAWSADRPVPAVTALHDCRRPFDNLVELTSQTCCELKLSPGEDLQKRIDRHVKRVAALGRQSLHVRFAPGTFRLAQPLVIRGLKGGELTVSGCGTRLLAETAECALVVTRWNHVTIRDLSVEAVVTRSGGTPPASFRNLGGAITALECGAVTIEQVIAACGSGTVRAASCITIRNDKQPVDARVRSCRLLVGTRQVGLLIVNAGRATVEDNQIELSSRTIASAPPRKITKRRLISNLRVGGTTLPTVDKGRVASTHDLGGGHVLNYVTPDGEVAALWAEAFKALAVRMAPPRRPDGRPFTRTDRFRVKSMVSAALDQVLEAGTPGPLTAELANRFRTWLGKDDQRPDLALATGGQGIVVGGVQAEDIRILGNTIAGVMDGIHLGVSTTGGPSTRRFLDRVQVIGNTVRQRIPKLERGVHAGIFIGNVNFATVRDNRVESELVGARVNNENVLISRAGHAIRVYGVAGDPAVRNHLLLITGNVVRMAAIGIEVVQVGGTPMGDFLSQVTQNLVAGASIPIRVDPDVKLGPDNIPAP